MLLGTAEIDIRATCSIFWLFPKFCFKRLVEIFSVYNVSENNLPLNNARELVFL